jgi:hypothetical protein
VIRGKYVLLGAPGAVPAAAPAGGAGEADVVGRVDQDA